MIRSQAASLKQKSVVLIEMIFMNFFVSFIIAEQPKKKKLIQNFLKAFLIMKIHDEKSLSLALLSNDAAPGRKKLFNVADNKKIKTHF